LVHAAEFFVEQHVRRSAPFDVGQALVVDGFVFFKGARQRFGGGANLVHFNHVGTPVGCEKAASY
jgi:hypothetical protein